MSEDLIEIFKKSNLTATEEVETTEVEDVRLKSTNDGFDGEEGHDANYEDIMTEEFEANDTRIAMIGNVDSGKSTLIGMIGEI